MTDETPVDIRCHDCGTHDKCEAQQRAEDKLAAAETANSRPLPAAVVLQHGDTVLLTVPELDDSDSIVEVRQQLEEWFPGITFRAVAPVTGVLVQRGDGCE